MYSFPNLEPVCSMSDSNCCLTCIQISQEAGKVVWYSHLFKDFPQFFVIHTVKCFIINNEVDDFLEFSCFSYNPVDVGNLISGSSVFSKYSLSEHLEVHSSCTVEAYLGEFWALLCYRVRWVQLYSSLNILWHCLSLGLEWKLTFFQSQAYWVHHFHSIIF